MNKDEKILLGIGAIAIAGAVIYYLYQNSALGKTANGINSFLSNVLSTSAPAINSAPSIMSDLFIFAPLVLFARQSIISEIFKTLQKHNILAFT